MRRQLTTSLYSVLSKVNFFQRLIMTTCLGILERQRLLSRSSDWSISNYSSLEKLLLRFEMLKLFCTFKCIFENNNTNVHINNFALNFIEFNLIMSFGFVSDKIYSSCYSKLTFFISNPVGPVVPRTVVSFRC